MAWNGRRTLQLAAAVLGLVLLLGGSAAWYYQVDGKLPWAGAHHDGFLFIAFGDTRTNHAAHRKVVKAIIAEGPELVLGTGDLVEHKHKPDEWATFIEIEEPLYSTVPYYTAIGNHEDLAPRFFQLWDYPGNERWFSIDQSNVHFIILDSNARLTAGSEQYRWLERDLQSPAAAAAEFIVMAFHHPPYTVGRHREDEKGFRDDLEPLLQEAQVSVVFNGHNHCYEHFLVEGIHYIVTGGGGAPLYGQQGESELLLKFVKAYHYCRATVKDGVMTIEAVTPEGRLLDTVRINRRVAER